MYNIAYDALHPLCFSLSIILLLEVQLSFDPTFEFVFNLFFDLLRKGDLKILVDDDDFDGDGL